MYKKIKRRMKRNLIIFTMGILIIVAFVLLIPQFIAKDNSNEILQIEPTVSTVVADKKNEMPSESDKTPSGGVLSLEPSIFEYNKGIDANLKTVHEVGEDDFYGCRFYASSSFSKIGILCSSLGDDVGNMTLALYSWDTNFYISISKSPISVTPLLNYKDNSYVYLEPAVNKNTFDKGEYVVVLSTGMNGVGVYNFDKSNTGTFIYNNGIESEGTFMMSIYYNDTPKENFKLLEASQDYSVEAKPIQKELIKEPEALTQKNAMSDTWPVTDGLIRTLPLNENTGNVRKDKFVGLFYWTWHAQMSNNRPVNINELITKFPGIENEFNNPLWVNYGAYCHWNQPIYGYYDGLDRWVLRRQAELLASAGVDVIIFDNTNGKFTWRDGFVTLCEVFEEARRDGVNTPKISFLLPFTDGENTVYQLREIYQTIYRDGLYKDLWFYWDGKPLMMSNYNSLNLEDKIEKEILNFFTFRPGQPEYNTLKMQNNDKWGWLSIYPQSVYYRSDGTPEQMAVGVAQNYSKAAGLTAMNSKGVFGRSYTSKGWDVRFNSKVYGANFSEQFEYALKIDPDFIFITGWNEWIAGRQKEWRGISNAFADEYNDEYSRDIEPSKGELKDYYYYQMVAYIRRYKGTSKLESVSAKKTIKMLADEKQWDDVKPVYIDYENDTGNRDASGYGNLHYVDKSGRNDIIKAQVARDDDYLYFSCVCKNNITSYTDLDWMNLYIDVESINGSYVLINNWESFEFVINRQRASSDKLVMERSLGGYNWQVATDVDYICSKDRMVIRVPKETLGLKNSSNYTVNFKWTDNVDMKDGDIMNFYVSGDVAPLGRYKYQYKVND